MRLRFQMTGSIRRPRTEEARQTRYVAAMGPRSGDYKTLRLQESLQDYCTSFILRREIKLIVLTRVTLKGTMSKFDHILHIPDEHLSEFVWNIARQLDNKQIYAFQLQLLRV